MQRWDVAKEFGLCFNCVSIDHKSQDCNSKSGCDRCNSRHHFLLHKKRLYQRTNSTTEKVANDKKPALKHEQPVKKSTVGGCVAFSYPHSPQIALMTLTAVRRDKKRNICGEVNFFAAIDTGATHTLGSRNLAEMAFGEWSPDEVREFKMFNGPTERYNVMTSSLRVKDRW